MRMNEVHYVEYWISCTEFTVWVQTRNGWVIACAPVVKRFRGHLISDLLRWFDRIGGFRIYTLSHTIEQDRERSPR